MTKHPQYQFDASAWQAESGAGLRNVISYAARVGPANPAGFFRIDAERLESVGGDPQPTWQYQDQAAEPFYVARRLRVQIVALRQRRILTLPDGSKSFVGWYTRRSEYPQGASMKPHVQLMVRLWGVPDWWVISLKGYSKTASVLNPPPTDGYHDSRFPTGVLPTIQEYFLEHVGNAEYPVATLWVDLVPALKGNRPLHSSLGRGDNSTIVNPFSADLRVPCQEFPLAGELVASDGARWVSMEVFERAEEKRIELRDGWFQWRDEATSAATPEDSQAPPWDPWQGNSGEEEVARF